MLKIARMKIAVMAASALVAATSAWAQSAPLPKAPPPTTPPANALAAATPLVALSSSEIARSNPGVQYLLIKTLVNKSIGVVNTRALPVEAEGYNLLKYCWTPANVLGDWGERSGVVGEMVVRAFETLSWARDLARAGYAEAPIAEAIGRYEAALIAADFADATRTRAVDLLKAELESLKVRSPGASDIGARPRCNRQAASFALNVATKPDDGRARFIPYVLHQFCLAQQIDPGDPVRCDYWMSGREGPISFAGETVYSVTWSNETTTTGRFDPNEQRAVGTVTLRERPLNK